MTSVKAYPVEKNTSTGQKYRLHVGARLPTVRSLQQHLAAPFAQSYAFAHHHGGQSHVHTDRHLAAYGSIADLVGRHAIGRQAIGACERKTVGYSGRKINKLTETAMGALQSTWDFLTPLARAREPGAPFSALLHPT